MNTEEFTDLIITPNSISKEQIVSLKSILEEFPYFQAAHVIHLKGLKKERNFKYNNTLKQVAAYTTNRTILFDFITADVLDYQEISSNEENILNEIEVIDSKLIRHLYESISSAKEEEVVETKQTLDVQTENIEKIISKKVEVESEKLKIGTPINFNRNDSFSFNEWLQLTPSKPVIRKEKQKKDLDLVINNKMEQSNKLESKLDLIEQFLIKKIKIKPVVSRENKDIAVESTQENTSLMTETLARVYLEQKKYSKAITAFKILSLKYPEKSVFFADRIRAIEFLQKHKT